MEHILTYDYFKVSSYIHRYMKRRFGKCLDSSKIILTEKDKINIVNQINKIIKVNDMENFQIIFGDFKITNRYTSRLYSNCMDIKHEELEIEYIPFFFFEEFEHLSIYVHNNPQWLPQNKLDYYVFNRTKFEYYFSFNLIQTF